jgi:signal transduction histidine kinase
MFDFVLNDLTGFLAAFIPGLINMALVVYIILSLPKNRMINVFILCTFCAAMWQINDALARISATAKVADIWDCITSAGWIMAAPLFFHFSVLYSKIIKDETSRWLWAAIYIPSFIFVGLYQAHVYEHHFHLTPFWGWVNDHDKNVLDIAMVYWLAGLIFLSLILLLQYAYKVRKDGLLRYQALIIFIGISIPAISGIISQAVIPIVTDNTAIPITSSTLTFFSIATVIALKKFRLFTISELVSNESLVDELPVIVISISDTRHITYINKLGCDLLHVEKNKARAYTLEELFEHSLPEHKSNFTRAYEKALQGEKVANVESSLTLGQDTMDILLSASPMINNNKVRGVLLCFRDITELKSKNLLLQQSNANLEEFAYVASHDLREPLRKIIAFGGMITNSEQNMTDKGKLYFGKMIDGALRMQVMIEDLLSLSIISQNNEFENYDLQEILDTVLKDLELPIKEKNAVIDSENLPVAYINPKQFRQLFLNLINNSLKFSRKDTPPVIKIKCSLLKFNDIKHIQPGKNSNYLKITIEDNGIGFENIYSEKIFQMFQRLHGKVDYDGTGIGLAVCKKIVENHKGTISATAIPGRGATFTIVIPHLIK